jgi:transcriptional antiterminator NusG
MVAPYEKDGSMSSESDPSHRWYMVHTLAGHEAKVIEALTHRVEALGLKEEVSEILLPTEKVEGSGDERPGRGKRMAYPGYILMRAAMSDAVQQMVRNTPKVTGFVGGREPTPLTDDEVVSIVGRVKQDHGVRRPDVRHDIGDTVRIIDGPFANFEGFIEQDDPERGVLHLKVSVFGRLQVVEVSYHQVQKT